LELHPPTQEVEIKAGPEGEGTSWSCAHGVARWYRDCGCTTGSQEGWNQAWRTPLRAALDFLRDQARVPFEEARGPLFKDPWAARNEYIYLVAGRGRGQEEFLARHTSHALQGQERIRALMLLELQRYCMLMYTSCGWFFADIGGIEATQVLKYAARAMDLLVEIGAASSRTRFLEILGEAKSNVPSQGSGADIFRRQVETLRMTPQRLAAHLAISGLQGLNGEQGQIGDFNYQRPTTRRGQQGRLTLATGQLKVQALAIGGEFDFNFAAVYFGGLDFYCVLRPHRDERTLSEATDRIWQQFASGSLLSILRLAQSEFGPDEYGLEDVLPDGRQQILEHVFGNLIDHFYDQYARLYEDNRQIINLLHESGFELPRELSVAAEFTLSHRFEEEIARQQGNRSPEAYAQAMQIAEEAARHGYQIEGPRARRAFEAMIESGVRLAVAEPTIPNLDTVTELLRLCRELRISPDLQRAQEAFYLALPSMKGGPQEHIAAFGLALGMSPKLTDHG
ncbi:MAG TPA: DUF3536 domain-containing protein, partial [bacterium]|nr:DUF3536 domain-containing protein [bacterium]